MCKTEKKRTETPEVRDNRPENVADRAEVVFASSSRMDLRKGVGVVSTLKRATPINPLCSDWLKEVTFAAKGL